MIIENHTRNKFMQEKSGVTMLLFELSAPESEFLALLGPSQGQITHNQSNQYLILLRIIVCYFIFSHYAKFESILYNRYFAMFQLVNILRFC